MPRDGRCTGPGCSRQRIGGGTLDRSISVSKPRGAFTLLPLRLVMTREPPQAAARARLKAVPANGKSQRRRIEPRTLSAADFLILLTSLDANDFPVRQLGKLYRVRWQVELAFKRLKSLLHIGPPQGIGERTPLAQTDEQRPLVSFTPALQCTARDAEPFGELCFGQVIIRHAAPRCSAACNFPSSVAVARLACSN
jgi:Transposase DDE domain